MKLWLGTYFSSILSLSCFELKESFFILYKQVQTLIINARRMNTFFVTKDQDLMVFVTYYGHPERAFFKNFELFGLGGHFGLKLFEAFGVFCAGLSALFIVLWVPCPRFPLFKNYFYKKLSLYIQGIWVWAAKILICSFRVSVVRGFVLSQALHTT